MRIVSLIQKDDSELNRNVVVCILVMLRNSCSVAFNAKMVRDDKRYYRQQEKQVFF
jgi:hypothetical protein